ncbi:efflux RND transporter periplasmic adaptor subunit [Venenivibrio stagnispumantis]|uniref:RND family efflux transporter, MFP subunit n=1 Tax=Venenivibrio stagnispumantis TaxID=407998 RepID=A0AA46ADC1_9AQUI|nr:efflux RND transporter periplasmic adaptor subunit [Venenivibrio stagnispumantis]MCW4572921.1 efflux RND transporter periplasmic adaptor subunit [Venenivibrio stagnispumantis]SMP04623.1 RND family efflux transporter, MFP subunit [Venenivibrio stagnispumantis]
MKKITLFLILFSFILSCQKKDETKKEKPTPKVSIVYPKETYINIPYIANGILESPKSAYIKPEVSGRIVKLYVDEGSIVKAGQLLAKIEPEPQLYQVESSQANISKLEAIYKNKKDYYERRKQLYERELISKEELDQAEADMKSALNDLLSAKANLKEASRNLKETNIIAPFSGIIDKRLANVGDYVDPSKDIFYILTLNPIRVKFSVPQELVKNIKLGQKIEVDIEGFGKKEAQVVYISSSLDQNSLVTIKAQLPNPDGNLKEGMYAKVNLIKDTVKGFELPEEVAIMEGTDNFLYIVDNQNKIQKTKIDILNQTYGKIYVTGDLDQNTKVVATNIFNVKPLMTVQIIGEKK